MAKTRAIRIRGKFPELKRVPEEVLVKAMPRVVQAVTEAAKAGAPKRRGEGSSKSIVRRITGKVEREGLRGVVYARAPHSHLIEFGVQGHALTPGSGKRRRRKGFRAMTVYGDPGILRRSAQHPGHRAQPFMEPAPEKAQAETNRILQQEGDRALEEAVLNAVEDLGGLLDKVIA